MNSSAANTILFFIYGDKREYHLELTYSVLSASHFLKKIPADIRIALVTNERNRRNDLPVEHLIFTDQDFARWTCNGAYNHGAKVHALLAAMDLYKGKVALVDTDTYFQDHPSKIFERIGPEMALMHVHEGTLEQHAYWRPILDNVYTPVLGYTINNLSPMYNSGVVGVDHSARAMLGDVQPLMEQLHSIYPGIHNIEQFSFASVILRHLKLNVCSDVVTHYYGYERRFIHCHIEALFPRFDQEIFRGYLKDVPSVGGYPPKLKVDLVASKLKTLQRRQKAIYGFAYLAYRSAFSSANKLYANAWSNVALDALTWNNFSVSHISVDFSQMRPERLSLHQWPTPETRRRWEEFWVKLYGHTR